MADYADLVPDLRPHAPQAPVPLLEDAARRAAIKLCRDSHIWREQVEVRLTAGKNEYRLRPRSGRVENIHQGQYEDTRVGRRDIREVSWGDITGLNAGENGQPCYFALSPDHGSVFAHPAPEAVESETPKLRLYCMLTPTRDGDTFPDFIEEEWREGIVHGALFYLYRMPGKQWTSQALAQRERFEFYTEINRATRESMTDNWAPQRTKMRKWV